MAEKLEIVIDGKAQGAVNATKQAETSINKLGKVIGGLAIGGGALILAQKGFQMLSDTLKKTVAFVKDVTEAAGYQELQIAKLNQALKTTGNYTEEVSEELQQFASELQKTTIYGDEATLAVEAMLATFKLNTEEIKVATQATLDLAAATGQDLQSAAILMGKAMVGEVGMLKRYGIIVDENKLAAEGWKAVIDEINIEFGGQATAQTDTYIGKLQQLKNVIGDLKETIGNAFLPTFTNLIDKFINGTEKTDQFGNVLSSTKAPLETIREYIQKAADQTEKFLDVLMNTDWSPVIDGLKNIGEALGILIRGNKSFEDADEKAQDFANTLGEIEDNLAGFLRSIRITIDMFAILGEVIDMVTIGPLETFKRGADNFTNAMQGNKDAVLENNAEVLNWGDNIDEIDRRIQNITDNVDSFGGGVKGATQTTDGLSSSIQSAITYLDNYKNATDRSTGATNELTGEIDDLTASLFELYNINQSVDEAQRNYEESLRNIKEGSEDYQEQIENSNDKLQRYMQTVEDAIESEKTSQYEKASLIGLYKTLGETAVETGITERSELDKVVDNLNSNIDNDIVPAWARAFRAANEYKDELNNIPREITTVIKQVFEGGGSAMVTTSGMIFTQKQSGGLIRDNQYSSDLNIPLVKGEAVLPAPVVRAIKENRGSFAGLGGGSGGSVTNYFNISELVVREEADINNIAAELYTLQLQSLRGVGIR